MEEPSTLPDQDGVGRLLAQKKDSFTRSPTVRERVPNVLISDQEGLVAPEAAGSKVVVGQTFCTRTRRVEVRNEVTPWGWPERTRGETVPDVVQGGGSGVGVTTGVSKPRTLTFRVAYTLGPTLTRSPKSGTYGSMTSFLLPPGPRPLYRHRGPLASQLWSRCTGLRGGSREWGPGDWRLETLVDGPGKENRLRQSLPSLPPDDTPF